MNATTVTVLVAIIAAGATLITALITLLTVLITKYKERTAAIAEENRRRMIPIYENMLTVVSNMVEYKRAGARGAHHRPELTQNLATWASTEVLTLYLALCEECRKTGTSGNDNLIPLCSDLVLALRNDLGYKKARLNDEAKSRIGAGVFSNFRYQGADPRYQGAKQRADEPNDGED